MNFHAKNNVLLRSGTVAERKDSNRRSKPVRTPKPFTVLQPVPGQNPKPLFIVHAYSIAQARALVAARLADTTGVVIVAPRKGSPR